MVVVVTSDDFPASRRARIELDAATAALPPVSGRRAMRREESGAEMAHGETIEPGEFSAFRDSRFHQSRGFRAAGGVSDTGGFGDVGGFGEPGAVESGVVQPGAVESGAVESGVVQPGVAESGVVESGVVEPGVVDASRGASWFDGMSSDRESAAEAGPSTGELVRYRGSSSGELVPLDENQAGVSSSSAVVPYDAAGPYDAVVPYDAAGAYGDAVAYGGTPGPDAAQWSDRELSEAEFDHSAAYKATLPGLRSDAAAAMRRKARAAALLALEMEALTAAEAMADEADQNPMFSSAEFTADPSRSDDALSIESEALGVDESGLEITPVDENPLAQLIAYRQMVESLKAEIESFGVPDTEVFPESAPSEIAGRPEVMPPDALSSASSEIEVRDSGEIEASGTEAQGSSEIEVRDAGGTDVELFGQAAPRSERRGPGGGGFDPASERERSERGSHRANRGGAGHQASTDRGRHAATRSARHRIP
jgi:hypothetical protein